MSYFLKEKRLKNNKFPGLSVYCVPKGLPGWHCSKELTCQCRRLRFDPWVAKIPWKKAWQPTPVVLPGESHGQRGLVGYSPWGRKESDTTEWLAHTHTCCKHRTGHFKFFKKSNLSARHGLTECSCLMSCAACLLLSFDRSGAASLSVGPDYPGPWVSSWLPPDVCHVYMIPYLKHSPLLALIMCIKIKQQINWEEYTLQKDTCNIKHFPKCIIFALGHHIHSLLWKRAFVLCLRLTRFISHKWKYPYLY